MKKIVLLSGIIIATLVSCSPEDTDTPTYEQNSNKTILSKGSTSDFNTSRRDTIGRAYVTDSIIAIDPVKPDRP